jgi:hypothetical protein
MANTKAKPMSINALLKRAKGHIKAFEDHFKAFENHFKAGEHRLRQAAEDIAVAHEQGASQRMIAEQVGRSASWVNVLLKWRAGGYLETPFGPQAKAAKQLALARLGIKQTESGDDADDADDKVVVVTRKIAKEYTNLIVNRKLYKGASELPWAQYFKYRDMHPGECAPLSNDDLNYVGQWTFAAPPPQPPPRKVSNNITHTGGTIRTIPDTTTYKPLNLNAPKAVHDANADNEEKASLLKQLYNRLLESDDWSNAVRIAGQSTVGGIINVLQRHLDRYITGGTGTDQAKAVPLNKLN